MPLGDPMTQNGHEDYPVLKTPTVLLLSNWICEGLDSLDNQSEMLRHPYSSVLNS